MGFNKRKAIKNKYKNEAGTQDKVIRIKEEIERSFIENCIYRMKKRLKEVIKTKEDKIKY